MKAVYNAHINSHLNYSNVVWGSMLSKTQLNDLHRIQKACMRIIYRKPPRSNADQLFRKSRVMPIDLLVELELLKFGYKITNGLTPPPITTLMHKNRGKKVHGYNTRNKNLPNIQKHQSHYYNKSFLNKSIISYQCLPLELKNSSSIKCFITKVKEMLLSP